MTDFTIRMYPGKPTALVSSAIIGSLMAAGLYEGEDYELIRSEPTDPLMVEPKGDEASGKHLFFMKKLYEGVQAKFAKEAHDLPKQEVDNISTIFSYIDQELADGSPNKRRASAIIDALKDVEGMI